VRQAEFNLVAMPREPPFLPEHLEVTEAQRRTQRPHLTPALLSQLPASHHARTSLQKNLETMGFGSHFLGFPWSLTSTKLADELTTLYAIPAEFQGNAFRGNLAPVTQDLVARIYGMRNEGEERPRTADSRHHEKYFDISKDNSDGYPLASCTKKELRDIFGFICPILDPSRPTKVHIYRFNQVYLSLYQRTKVNWARLLYRTLHKCSEALGRPNKPSYITPFLFHYYNFCGVLTETEQRRYDTARAQIQDQLVQVGPLRPDSPEVPPSIPDGAPPRPNSLGGPTGTPRQARTRDAGDGSGRPGDSRQSSPEPRTEPDSPGYSNESKDHESEEEYTPSGRSSARGKKRKSPSRSRSLEHSSKVPRLVLGTGPVYQQKEVGGSSRLVPYASSNRESTATGSTSLVPTMQGIPPSPAVPVGGPIGTSQSVTQQPNNVPVLGTADRPVELGPSDLAQEDSDEEPVPDLDVSFERYNWLFTNAKADRVNGVDAGQRRYQHLKDAHWKAADAYRHECELRDVRLATCSNFLSDLARYLAVPPEELGQGVKTLKDQLREAQKQLEKVPGKAEQERLQQLEAQNQKLEQALTLMGDVLQQHTKRWATACYMLTRLEELTSTSLYVAGKAYIDGLQPPEANLIMHLIQNLPGELTLKLNDVRNLVGEFRNTFGIVVPAYRWDKEHHTFERVTRAVAKDCMSRVPEYLLTTDPSKPLMGQLPEIPEINQILNDRDLPGADPNRLQD
jgi:hypothetical protein